MESCCRFGLQTVECHKLSCSVHSLYCHVILYMYGHHPREHDFERRGRNSTRRGLVEKSQNSVLYLYEIRTGHFTSFGRTTYRSGSPFWPPWMARPVISNSPGLRTPLLNVFHQNTRSSDPVGRFTAFVFLPPPSTCMSYFSLLIPPRSR
jgi:hypothetical protein